MAASLRIVLRVVAIIVGGYGASAAFVVILSRMLFAAGVEPSEGYTLAALLGLMVYLVAVLWGAAEPRLGRVFAVLSLGVAAGVVAFVAA